VKKKALSSEFLEIGVLELNEERLVLQLQDGIPPFSPNHSVTYVTLQRIRY